MTVDQLIWALFLVGVPVALAFHYFYNAKRATDLLRFARKHGYSYTASDAGLESKLPMSLPIFEIGKERRFTNVLRVTLGGREVTVFDYRHRVGGVLTSVTHKSILADLAIGREKNRQVTYYNMTMVAVRAPRSSRATREHLPGMLGGHTRLECADNWLVVYRFDRRVPKDKLKEFVQAALAAADRTAATMQAAAA